MATTETITVEMLLASDKFRTELGKVVAGIKKVEDGTKSASTKSSSALNSLKLAWVAVAAAVYKTIGFAREAVADAIKADRQMRQLAQAYSGMGDEAKKMASEIGKAFAMQDDDVAALLARLGTLLQNMGLTKAEALEMSGAMVRVGADLARLWGTDTETAVQAIQNALTGNGRALKQFGMDVDEASIKQHALTLGIGDGKRALTQAETAMAAMSLVTKSAGNAIGETARQWNSFEMAVQRANVALQDVKEAIGRGIIAGLAPAMEDFSGATAEATKNAEDLQQGIMVAVRVFLALVDVVNLAVDVVVFAWGNMINGAMTFLATLGIVKDNWMAIAKAFGQVAAGDFKGAWRTLSAQASNAIETIKVEWGSFFNGFKDSLGNFEKDAKHLASLFANMGPPGTAPTEGAAPVATPSAPRGNPFVSLFGVTEEDMREAGATYEEMLLSNEETWSEIEEAHVAEEDRLRDERVQKEFQALSTQAQYWSQYLTQIGNLVAQYSDARAAKEISNIDKERDKRIAAYDAMLAAGTLTEEEYQRKRTEVEEEAEREIHKVKLRAFRAEKQGKMMSTVMAGALAVIQAFAQLGPIGGAIASLIIAGITAAQLSLINQQTMPEYAQGGIAGLNGPEVALVGERGPELIIPAGQTQQLLAGGAGGGGVTFGQGSIVLNIANGTAQNVERGVMNALKRISDDRGIRNPLSRG